jgi:SAM-dependent methyltransferase
VRREACGGCGSPDLQQFLDLGSSPLADRFPATADEPEDWYPLQVAVCTSCWLVQQLEVVPDALLFGEDYGFFTGTSPSAVAYFGDYADWLVQRFEPGGGLVVEVACNDGTLLAELGDCGFRYALGVEPAFGPADAARERGLDVVGEPFGVDVARRIVAEYGAARLVVANNVAAHVADLDDFFAGIAALLAPNGAAVVEVQYVADLLAGNQFDHVYHEHRFFFSGASLATVMRHHGLDIRAVQRTPAQGGSIRVIARLASSVEFTTRWPSWPDLPFLQDLNTYQGIQGRVDYLRDRLNQLLADELDAGRKVAGYAATAKSATLLNFCGLSPAVIDHIVDMTPQKIGRFTPGSKIPIVAPGDRPEPDTYLLLAWNYLSGVLRRERAFVDDGGRFLVPIPYPVLL